jgi:hypothetical protein
MAWPFCPQHRIIEARHVSQALLIEATDKHAGSISKTARQKQVWDCAQRHDREQLQV